jgi:hypothetical protein
MVLLDRLYLTPEEINRCTGWQIKEEGACKGDICVPLTGLETRPDGTIDMRLFAPYLGMPVVIDAEHDLIALGPRAGGRVLDSVKLPSISLDDFEGNIVHVDDLQGSKVLLLAWASW